MSGRYHMHGALAYAGHQVAFTFSVDAQSLEAGNEILVAMLEAGRSAAWHSVTAIDSDEFMRAGEPDIRRCGPPTEQLLEELPPDPQRPFSIARLLGAAPEPAECNHEGTAEIRFNPELGRNATWCPRCRSFFDLFDPRYAPGGPLDPGAGGTV